MNSRCELACKRLFFACSRHTTNAVNRGNAKRYLGVFNLSFVLHFPKYAKNVSPSRIIVSEEVKYMSTENDQLTIWIQNMRTNRDAFAALYEEMSRPMYTVACRILHNRSDAADVVQDVFLKMLKTDDFAAVGNIRAYILQMVRNEALMLLRKRSKEDLVEEVSAEQDAAWQGVSVREDVAAITSAIERLKDDERDIFTFHVNGELGFEEIAGIMNMSLSAVYRRYQKALKKLRKMLNGGNL